MRFGWFFLVSLFVGAPLQARVIINEIMYHAPEDLTALQYIELHNTGDSAADIGGWKFTKGVSYEFPRETVIPPRGYVVVCQSREWFARFYTAPVSGEFEGVLKRGGERIELSDAAGQVVESLKYQDHPPWPIAPDGFSASLERISPESPANLPENWLGSPLSRDPAQPGGSPGRRNSQISAVLPPYIHHVQITPLDPTPGDAIQIECEVEGEVGIQQVMLHYRVARPGGETPATILPMRLLSENHYLGTIPPQRDLDLLRLTIHAVNDKGAERIFPGPSEPRPALSLLVHTNFTPGRIPWALIINTAPGVRVEGDERRRRFSGSPPEPVPPAQGTAAFVWVEPGTNRPKVFDFVAVAERPAGWKVHFHHDRPLNDLTTISLIFEQYERFVLAEPLAFELYRRAGNAACLTTFARVTFNGKPLGYHLLIEQPNKAFLRRNGLRDDGNLYKLLWYEDGVIGQHEKKTNLHSDHEDLVQLVNRLNQTKNAEQSELIRKEFNVEQVITYFAVNSLLSYWDGFFNDYFTYHDVSDTGKWEIYPWDQDKTFGYYDGIPSTSTFYELPLTYGAEGDVPPGWNRSRPPPRHFFEAGSPWWRPGGWFSKPLLANPWFMKHYLSRIKELLETEFTEEALFPILDGMRTRLEAEVRFRAQIRKEDPVLALERFDRNVASIKENIKNRRKWLFAQPEIQNAGAFDRTQLK